MEFFFGVSIVAGGIGIIILMVVATSRQDPNGSTSLVGLGLLVVGFLALVAGIVTSLVS